MTSAKDSLLRYLKVLDAHLLEIGSSTNLHLSGGAAVILAYGGNEQTKDVDAVADGANAALVDLQKWAGQGTKIAEREGYFFEVVPPIFPRAPGMLARAVQIEGADLKAITAYAIELHDLIITKLGRFHAKDRTDIELLCRVPTFKATNLRTLYEAARGEMKMYWPDQIEKTDRNFNRVLVGTLGLPAIDWSEDE